MLHVADQLRSKIGSNDFDLKCKMSNRIRTTRKEMGLRGVLARI